MTLLPALLLPLATAAEPTFTPELQYRPRYELDTGRDFAPGGAVSFVTHRARLGGTTALGDLAIRVVLQDVRAWGEELNTRRDFTGDGIDLPIGLVSWSPGPVELRVGRDEIGLFGERLVARSVWRQPGRHLDGARLLVTPEGWSAEAAGTIIADGDTFAFSTQDQVVADTGDVTLSWLRGGMDREGRLIQGLVLLDTDGRVEGAEQWRLTPGVHVELAEGPWRLQVEGYGQVGAVADVATFAAWMAGLRAGWVGDGPSKPAVTLGYDALSADTDPADDRLTAFNTLQGANHRYYGHMDVAAFFRGGPADGTGLHDARVDLSLQPADGLTLTLMHHVFARGDGTGLLATEPDLHAKLKVTDGLTASLGAAAWVPLDDSGDPVESWAYLMLDAAFPGPTLGGAD